VVDGENIKANTQAQKISENGAFVPIDKTPGGEEFNKLNLYKKFDDDKAFADYIWGDILSNKYSSQASGTINILAEHVSVSSVFNTIETPNILSGIDTGRVTEINILPNDIFKLITPTN